MTAPGGAYAAFRPELHPRDSHGRFRDKWGLPAAAKKLVDGIVDAFKPMTGRSDDDLQAKVDAHAAKQKRTPKQKAALDRFTSNGFAPVQADLRAGKPNADAKEMDSMLEPLPEDMFLTRVVGPEAFGLPPQRISEVEEWTGKLVADKGFAPTNAGTPLQVAGPHVTLSIMTPKGTPAIIPGGSREVILGRDQPLRIVKVDSDGRGGVYVYAVAQPSGRTRALGRGMRASEKAPAIEATPEELKKRGLQEPSPAVAGVPSAPGAVPSGTGAPQGTPEAPAQATPEVGAPDAKIADREARVADREAKVAEREAQVAELRGAKKAGKKATKAAPNAIEQVPADRADDKLNADQIQRWRDAIGDDVELPQLHETMLAMTAEQLRKKEITREGAVEQLNELARDKHTPADDFLRKVATIIGVGPEGKKVRAPRKKAEPGAAKKTPAKKAGNLAEEVAARFPAKKAAPKKTEPKAATPAPVKKATSVPVKKVAKKAAPKKAAVKNFAPGERVRDIPRHIEVGDTIVVELPRKRDTRGKLIGPRKLENRVVARIEKREGNNEGYVFFDKDDKEISNVSNNGKVDFIKGGAPGSAKKAMPAPVSAPKTEDGREIKVGDRVGTPGMKNQDGWTVTGVNSDGTVDLVSNGESGGVRKGADPNTLTHLEAPKRGRHAVATTPPPSSEKLPTKEALLEERRKQRAAARDRQQQIAHAQGIAGALAELAELERKIASGTVMAQHVRAIADGPDVEEIRDAKMRDELKRELNAAADELAAGQIVNGIDLVDNLARKHDIELVNDETGFVDFNPDEHESVHGRTIAPGAKVKIIRPGAILHKGGQVELFKAKVILAPPRLLKRKPAPRPEDIPELAELQKLPIDKIKEIAREQHLNTEDAFGRIPKHGLIAMLDGRRLAKQRMRDLDPDRKWKRAELEAMKADELRNLIKAHGMVPPRGRKLDLVEVLVGRLVNEPNDRNEIPDAAGGFADLDIKELRDLAERNGIDAGWNPARAQLIRKLLAAGVDDPNLPVSKKSIKGLKLAIEELGIRVPPNATREELISILADPPKIDYHQTVPARLKKLIASVASGVKRFNPIADGAMGDTSKAEMEDGGEAIRKVHKHVFGQNPRRQADAEQLASVLAEVIGAPTPPVYRQDGRTIFMGFVTGRQAAAAGEDRRQAAIQSPEGELLGLLDALTGNSDRHMGNWMISPAGKPIGIDHGLAWSIDFNVHSNPDVEHNTKGEIMPNVSSNMGPFRDYFADDRKWLPKIVFSRKRLEEIKERMQAQRPQFDLLGRGEWFDVSMGRLDAIIERAALP